MLPDPPTITLAPALPVNIGHLPPSAHYEAPADHPTTIAPFSHQANSQEYYGGDYPIIVKPDNYSQLNHDYLRKKYRRKYDNPQKMTELLLEQTIIVENLVTAIAGKMDIAAIGVLSGIINSLDGSGNVDQSTGKATVDSGDKQRALHKAGLIFHFFFIFFVFIHSFFFLLFFS